MEAASLSGYLSSACRRHNRNFAHAITYLAVAVEALIRNASAVEVAVAFHDLASGDELLIHADVNFHPASTIKVPIMMEVFRQAEQKTFSLDDRVAIKNDF